MPMFRSKSKQCCIMTSSNQRRWQAHALTATALTSLVFTAAQTSPPSEHSCPPELDGWAPSADCTQYYWCSGGSLLSISYGCVEGTLFDVAKITCLPADEVNCTGAGSTVTESTVTNAKATIAGGATEDWSHALSTESEHSMSPIAPIESEHSPPSNAPIETVPSAPSNAPTPRQSYFGEPIYFPDFPSQSCKSEGGPSWLTPENLFTSKKECCETVMDWIPLETCLGPDWVEPNVMWPPTGSPTVSPSQRPTNGPSESPSYMPSSSEPTASPSSSEPTVAPSMVPTGSPNNAPTHSPSKQPTISPSFFISNSPTLSPTTASPTLPPSEDPIKLMSAQLGEASRVDNSYLIDLVGWANDGMETYSQQAFTSTNSYGVYGATEEPTPSPIALNSDSSLSELILPIADDATVSMQRPDTNFGSHQALAVDGGDASVISADSSGEKFDALLKFDLSLVDGVVESATLKLYIVEGCKSGGILSTTSSVDWKSGSVTWENAPVADGELIGRLPAITAGQWYDVDVTSALSWHDSQYSPYLSIRIESDENSRCLYSSMESGESVSPRLVVRYAEEAIVEMSVSFEENKQSGPPPATGDFILLKATDDATVVGSNPTRNFGAEPNLLVAVDTDTRNMYDTLIKFDLTELVSTPPRTAVLSLYAETDCASAGMFTTTSSDDWSESEVTWINAPIYEPQSTAGGVSLGVFGAVSIDTWNAFNVLSAINDAVKAGKNAVTFRLSSGNLNSCQFSSRDGGRAPKLMLAF